MKEPAALNGGVVAECRAAHEQGHLGFRPAVSKRGERWREPVIEPFWGGEVGSGYCVCARARLCVRASETLVGVGFGPYFYLLTYY